MSNIHQAINQEQFHRWADVPGVFALYSNPNDPVVHDGLLRRRIAEGELWLSRGPYAQGS